MDALENDAAVLDEGDFDDPDDDEFVLEDSNDEDEEMVGKKRKKKGKKGKRRGSIVGKGRGPKTLQDWIDQDNLEDFPEYEPTYLSAVAQSEMTRSVRHFCSVCGQGAPYTCVRCGTRFCCLKCSVIHNETRCLKFTA